MPVIATLNGVFNLIGILFISFAGISCFVLKNKDRKIKRYVVVFFYTLVFAIWIVYKILLLKDVEYAGILAQGGQVVSLWDELPLDLCNICMIITPLACLFDCKYMYCFAFFLSPVAGILGLFLPVEGFSGYGLFIPRVAGYYITHFSILIVAIFLYGLGLFRPVFKSVKHVVIECFSYLVIIFIINGILRITGLNPMANYAYVMETEGKPIISNLWNVIPIPLMYMMFGVIVILLPYFVIVTLISEIAGKNKAGRNYEDK